MNIIVACTLLVCLLDPSSAVRLRENLNVLVPSNDVNLHAKVKKLLNGDEVDPEDFSDNEIESLSEMKFPKVEKLRNNRHLPAVNKVFDDDNKNRIDHDSDELLSTLSDVMSLDSNNSPIELQKTYASTEKSFSQPWTPIEFNFTSPAYTEPSHTPPSFSNNWTSSGVSTESSIITPNATTSNTSNKTHTYSSEPLNSNTVRQTTPTFYATTPFNETTSTFNTTTLYNETTPTTSSITTNATSTTGPNLNTTISINSTTTETSTAEPTLNPTTEEPPYPETLFNEDCLLRRSENYLEWLHSNGSLNNDYIKKFIKRSCLDYQIDNFLSFAYQNLSEIPDEVRKRNSTLQYLSLSGNDLTEAKFDSLPELLELDLRNCRLTSVPQVVNGSRKLRKLFLSNNHITQLTAHSFPPTLKLLDLSDNSLPISIAPDSFTSLNHLETLDLSHAKIIGGKEAEDAVNSILGRVTEISLCFTNIDLQKLKLTDYKSLKKLDLSGMTLPPGIFDCLPTSLEALSARHLMIQHITWAERLDNLKHLDLSENNIEFVNDAFIHMSNLTEVNLSSNMIESWITHKFRNNKKLKFLDLRNNHLTSLTDNMKTDLMGIPFIAIGNNKFICDCELQTFMRNLFNNTNANRVTYGVDSNENSSEECVESATQRVVLGVRNQIRPQYDVMSRTYQKYYDLAKVSVEALNAHVVAGDSKVFKTASRDLIMRSNAAQKTTSDKSTRTVLFDYSNDTYVCYNEEDNSARIIREMDYSLCIDEPVDDDGARDNINKSLLAIWISFPVLIISCILLFVVYWKWWYIRYFLVMFKNTAILTFMDDSDGDKETIIKGKGDESVDVYLYDVFVSYSDHNREWVLEEFIPNVERRETINVCLHERDFQVGCGILENIVSCMDRSRCLLLLISESFLLSQWCQFEMNLAQHRLLETRREKLILVLLEDIPTRKQPRTLKYLMRTKTYIKWPVNGTSDEKQVFWKRLKKAIISSQWENDSYGSIA